MPHQKKPRLDGPAADAAVSAVVDRYTAVTANELSGDIIAIIFGCFPPEDIMRMRRVCKKWREAAKKANVSMAEFSVDSVDKCNALVAMATALPNLQQLSICGLRRSGSGHKYSDGEDPDRRIAAATADLTSHDVNIISNFKKLRVLNIHRADLNGGYPVLFDFPLLRELSVFRADFLKFDLGMLSGLPSLKSLKLSGSGNKELTGNLSSLRVLKDTLEMVEIKCCERIEGNFMDLADFPRLKKLDLVYTQVTGDIRDIGEDDFPALESLSLPESVSGGMYYKFQHVSEVPSTMQAIHLLLQRNPTLFDQYLLPVAFRWSLSEDSPDWYDYDETSGCPRPPFFLQNIRAGGRTGWSWYSDDYHSCEINWLDPEPSSESSGYEDYTEELQLIEGELNTDFYRGYHEPPTEMEYRRLCEGLEQRD